MSGTLTVTHLARRFGLARSTLLYYDRIGLLRPSGRSGTGYRHYTAREAERLEQICHYRSLGIPLREIAPLLDLPGQGTAAVLQRRARQLEGEIASLKEQLRVVLRILQAEAGALPSAAMSKENWVSLLRAAGLDDGDMQRWHCEFERLFPEAHQAFLQDLGIPGDEIRSIREHSGRRTAAP